MFIVDQNGNLRNVTYMKKIYPDGGYVCYDDVAGGSRVLGKYESNEAAVNAVDKICDAVASGLNLYKMPT